MKSIEVLSTAHGPQNITDTQYQPEAREDIRNAQNNYSLLMLTLQKAQCGSLIIYNFKPSNLS